MKKNKINNKLLIRRLAIILTFLLILLFLICNLFSNGKLEKNAKTVLEIGAEVIDLSHDVIIEDGKNIYVSYDDIKKIYDDNIFFDEANKSVITTYNKHIAILQLDKNEIEINDATSTLQGQVKYINDVLYLPFSDLKIVYDFEYKYSEKTNTIMVDSISKSKKTGKLIRAAKIKKNSKFFSKKLLKIHKGKEVQVFEEVGKYYKIRTEDGIIGYIYKERIDKLNVLRDDMEDDKITNINILSNYSKVADDYSTVDLDSKKNNVVSPEIFELNNDKDIKMKISTNSDTYQYYKEWTENNNISIWATLTTDSEVSDNMVTYNDRKEIIDNIYSKMIENNYKVLNIKFDKINDINSFYRFLIEITPKLKEVGIKTVVTFNSSMNEEKVSKIVDYVVKEVK